MRKKNLQSPFIRNEIKHNSQSPIGRDEINYNLAGMLHLRAKYQMKYIELTKLKELLCETDERLLESMSKETKSEMSKRLCAVHEKFQSCLDEFDKIADMIQTAAEKMRDGDAEKRWRVII